MSSDNKTKQTGIKYLLEKKKIEEVLGEDDGYHAWFSYKQKYHRVPWEKSEKKKHSKSNIYLDFDGNEVEVTCVCKNINYKCGWDDLKYVGKVKEWARGVYE